MPGEFLKSQTNHISLKYKFKLKAQYAISEWFNLNIESTTVIYSTLLFSYTYGWLNQYMMRTELLTGPRTVLGLNMRLTIRETSIL